MLLFSLYYIKYSYLLYIATYSIPDGQRHLGAVIGHRDYTVTYATSKVKAWCDEVKHLAEVVDIFPHAAYAAFTYALFSYWSYFLCTIYL